MITDEIPLTDNASVLLLTLCTAYLIGAIPFGWLIGKCAGLGDIRTQGSGNIGATNMVRAGGKWLGLLTLILDACKGIAAIALLTSLTSPPTYTPDRYDAYLWGIAAVVGHCFPFWLSFKGGKGVATAFGVLTYLHLAYVPHGWWLVILLTATWIAVFFFYTHRVARILDKLYHHGDFQHSPL